MVVSKENLISARAFFIGIILAILMGLTVTSDSTNSVVNTFFIALLVGLGILIGYLNAGEKDTSITFLLASLALVIVGGEGNSTLVFIGNISPVLKILNNILRMLLVLFVPATIVAALKVVFSMAKV